MTKEEAVKDTWKERALRQAEKDPTGRDPHSPGAKLDSGKLRPHLVLGGFANALEQVVKVGTDGAAKYSDNGWKEVEGGESRYMDALGRHLLALQKGETHDPLSGSPHLAHIAWNALAVLEITSAKMGCEVGNVTTGGVGKVSVDFLMGVSAS